MKLNPILKFPLTMYFFGRIRVSHAPEDGIVSAEGSACSVVLNERSRSRHFIKGN